MRTSSMQWQTISQPTLLLAMQNGEYQAIPRPLPQQCAYFYAHEIPELPFMLASGERYYIERAYAFYAKRETIWAAIESPHQLTLSLCSSSILDYPVARLVTEHLTKRLRLNDDLQHRLHTAFHEALQNAVVHGNWQSRRRVQHLQDMEHYYQELARCRVNPQLARMRVVCAIDWNQDTLSVAVSDEGERFTIDTPTLPPPEEWHGRGMYFIASCCETYELLPDRKTFCMRFDRHAK